MAKQADGSLQIDPSRFFEENLNYPAQRFDAVLFWDVADYLPEVLVKPLVERLQTMLKAKGYLLAFFHSKDEGADSLYSRHHIVKNDTLELELLQRFSTCNVSSTTGTLKTSLRILLHASSFSVAIISANKSPDGPVARAARPLTTLA